MLYLKRGETLTYGTRESLTPFEVVCLSLKKVDSLNLKQWVVTFFKGKSI